MSGRSFAAGDWSERVRGLRATQALARRWGREIGPGTVLALVGEMGAGKTCFVQGLAEGLGVPDRSQVVSPTYTLVNEYLGGRLPLVHLDFYRLDEPEDGFALGLDEQIGRPDAVTAVEWADHLPELLPPTALWVHFSFVDDGAARLIEAR